MDEETERFRELGSISQVRTAHCPLSLDMETELYSKLELFPLCYTILSPCNYPAPLLPPTPLLSSSCSI